MPLEVIYVVRHGFRLNFSVDPVKGTYHSTFLSPTGLPADVTLTLHGVEQARELAAHLTTVRPPIDNVYSSPWYRCLQTVEPFVRQRGAVRQTDRPTALEIRPETGLSEWFGTAQFQQPMPASAEVLKEYFPALDQNYVPVVEPPRTGETIPELHDRVALTAGRLIDQCDAEGSQAVLLCTHAAVVIALGRVLTGSMPSSGEADDFRAFTCGLSVYRRRSRAPLGTGSRVAEVPGTPGWAGGRGVRGGWEMERNSDCSFLSQGEERGWQFSGEETFPVFSQQEIDGAIGLGLAASSSGKATQRSHKGDPRL